MRIASNDAVGRIDTSMRYWLSADVTISKPSSAHQHHNIVISAGIVAGSEWLPPSMVPTIFVVLLRCAHNNVEYCADFFASIVHLPSNGISCSHLSSVRHSVAMSTPPTLGADHDVACFANPTTPNRTVPRRPIRRGHGSQRARSAALRHFFFIIVGCRGPTTVIRSKSASACFGASSNSSIRPRALSRLIFSRKGAKFICCPG